MRVVTLPPARLDRRKMHNATFMATGGEDSRCKPMRTHRYGHHLRRLTADQAWRFRPQERLLRASDAKAILY